MVLMPHICNVLCVNFFSAGVTIGLQQSEFTVSESSWIRSVEVCAVIKCGCIRQDVEVTLDVREGTAVGMQ